MRKRAVLGLFFVFIFLSFFNLVSGTEFLSAHQNPIPDQDFNSVDSPSETLSYSLNRIYINQNGVEVPESTNPGTSSNCPAWTSYVDGGITHKNIRVQNIEIGGQATSSNKIEFSKNLRSVVGWYAYTGCGDNKLRFDVSKGQSFGQGVITSVFTQAGQNGEVGSGCFRVPISELAINILPLIKAQSSYSYNAANNDYYTLGIYATEGSGSPTLRIGMCIYTSCDYDGDGLNATACGGTDSDDYVFSTPSNPAPGAVTNLRNTTTTSNSITWSWTNPSDTDLSRVKICLNNNNPATCPGQNNPYTTTSATFTGLSAGTQYTVYVWVNDTSGQYSSVASHVARTLGVSSGPSCGNFVCETGETQSSCCSDCGCPSGQSCSAGVCSTTPPSGTCTINDVFWSTSSAGSATNPGNIEIEAGKVINIHTRANSACDGQPYFRVQVKEVDLNGWPSGENPSFTSSPNRQFLTSSGISSLSWYPVEWIQDTGGINQDPEYIFRVWKDTNNNQQWDSGETYRDSNELKVTKAAEPPTEPPKANITAPVHKGIYFEDREILFDNNPGLNPENYEYLWVLDPTSNKPNSGDEYTNTSKNFTYTPTTPGELTVTLRVSDPSSDLYDEEQIGILVVSSPGIFAFIEKPSHLQVLDSSNSKPRKVNVDFSARDSYFVNVSDSLNGNNCPTFVDCIAGECPIKTENTPQNCGLVQLDVSGTPKNFDLLNFSWVFKDGFKLQASGNAGVESSRVQAESGETWVDLNVSLGSLSVQTRRDYTAGRCVDNGATFISDIGEKISTIGNNPTSGIACGGADGDSTTQGDNCCPSGQICGENGCIFDNSNITQCSSYLTEQNCIDDPYNAWKDDPLNKESTPPVGVCGGIDSQGNTILCSCFWNATSTTNKCGFKKTVALSSDNEYSCGYIYTNGECVNGIMKVNVQVQFSTTNENIIQDQVCPPVGELSVLCGRKSFELPFFDYRNFIAAAIIIFTIYVIMRDRKK